MKLNNVLLKQHIGWHFSKVWNVQSKRKIIDNALEAKIKQKNIDVCKPNEILNTNERLNVSALPNINKNDLETVLLYNDSNVLVEGFKQAKIITNTIELTDFVLQDTEECGAKKYSSKLQKMAKEVFTFDAEQKKLPKVKDPQRPSWNFPRSYGISKNKISINYISKILQCVDLNNKRSLDEASYNLQDLFFQLPLERYGSKIILQLTVESGFFSKNPLPVLTTELKPDTALPDISPLDPLISLSTKHVDNVKTIYPLQSNGLKLYPHTIFAFYNSECIQNEFELPVLEHQIFGRSLLKAFTVAGTFARKTYGDDVQELPKPVTIQSIQTDGNFVHFGIFQLNTLNLNESTNRNIWYQTPLIKLYEDSPSELHISNVANNLHYFCNRH